MLARDWLERGVVVAVLAGVVVLAGCEKPAAPQPPPPAMVYVARPETRTVQDYDDFTGQIDAVSAVDLRARVTGQVVERPFVQGTVVQKGDVLYRIDDKPFRAELARAEAVVGQAEAQLKRSQQLFDRAKSLIDTKAISQEEFDQREQDVYAAKASLKAAEAAAEASRLNVEYCTVVAPMTGRTSRGNIDPGNMVDGGKGDSTMLTTIVQTAPVYCYFDVDERSYVNYVARLGATRTFDPTKDLGRLPVFVGLSGESDYPFTGSVDFVDNRLDRSTGTIRVRAVFANEQERLVAGMFARVRVPKGEAKPTLVIPESALNKDQGRTFVMVMGEGHKRNAKGEPEGDAYPTPTYRPIVTGRAENGMVAVLSGIGPEDRVVVSGLISALQAMGQQAPVNPVETTATAATQPGFPPLPTTAPAK